MDPTFQTPSDQSPVLILTRVLNAPRALVWKAFSEPFHLAQWWGPQGFTNPVCELDFRPGGHWRHVMRGPDGAEYETNSTFIEIVPPERIVYRNAVARGAVWRGNPPPSFLRTLSFAEADGSTILTLRAEFESAAEKHSVIRRGFTQGTNESWDKLETYLKAL